jgi:hypothetical protein
MPKQPQSPVELFFSYSHKDEELRRQLEVHLTVLERLGLITGWHDRKITAGVEWENALDTHLNTAKIILLLISADFIASDYCYGIEMQRAFERHRAGEAYVIPIILRPCDWEETSFAKFQALPKDGRPVTSWGDQDEALKNVTRGIKAAIQSLPDFSRTSLTDSSQAVTPFAERSTQAGFRAEPSLGPLVFKLCDRSAQVNTFADFFIHNLKNCAGAPQIYFIQGKETECHESLVERLIHTHIIPIAEKKWGEQKGVVLLKKPQWVYEGEPIELQRELRRSIFAEFDRGYIGDDLSAGALSNLISSSLYPLVVIRHNIYAEHWNNLTRGLLEWYINYWTEISGNSSGTQFLIFLNVIYPAQMSGVWWKSWFTSKKFDKSVIQKELQDISTTSNKSCPCLLLKELAPPRQYDVGDWFAQHNIYDEKMRRELMQKIFETKDVPVTMAEIEHELKRIHQDFIRTRGYS